MSSCAIRPTSPYCLARACSGSHLDLLCGHAALRPALAGNFVESQNNEVKFPEINAKILEKTVQYFYYKQRHTNHAGPLPEFKIEPEAALELLMAANYLDA